jgi:hypothetical protein
MPTVSFVSVLRAICLSTSKDTDMIFTSSFYRSKAWNIVISLVSALKCLHYWDTCNTQYRCTDTVYIYLFRTFCLSPSCCRIHNVPNLLTLQARTDRMSRTSHRHHSQPVTLHTANVAYQCSHALFAGTTRFPSYPSL